MSRSDLVRQARAELEQTIAALGAEEVVVLSYLARRLHAGQQAYGKLDLANDRRDLEVERGAELADSLVYGAMAELRRVLTRGAAE